MWVEGTYEQLCHSQTYLWTNKKINCCGIVRHNRKGITQDILPPNKYWNKAIFDRQLQMNWQQVWRHKQDRTHTIHQQVVLSLMNIRTHKANNYAGLQHTYRVCWQTGEWDNMINISDTILGMVVDKISIFHLLDLTILNPFLLLLISCGTQMTHQLPTCPPTELCWKR
jgi:hypothetical protein